jgi:hypothetical protein
MKKATKDRTQATPSSGGHKGDGGELPAAALPQDHLPPAGTRDARTDAAADVPPRDGADAVPRDGADARHVAQRTPGEANVGVRPHLEGSEQGPQ